MKGNETSHVIERFLSHRWQFTWVPLVGAILIVFGVHQLIMMFLFLAIGFATLVASLRTGRGSAKRAVAIFFAKVVFATICLNAVNPYIVTVHETEFAFEFEAAPNNSTQTMLRGDDNSTFLFYSFHDGLSRTYSLADKLSKRLFPRSPREAIMFRGHITLWDSDHLRWEILERLASAHARSKRKGEHIVWCLNEGDMIFDQEYVARVWQPGKVLIIESMADDHNVEPINFALFCVSSRSNFWTRMVLRAIHSLRKNRFHRMLPAHFLIKLVDHQKMTIDDDGVCGTFEIDRDCNMIHFQNPGKARKIMNVIDWFDDRERCKEKLSKGKP